MTKQQTAMQWVMVLTTCVIIPLVLTYRDRILELISQHPNVFLMLSVITAMVLLYLKLSKEDESHENE